MTAEPDPEPQPPPTRGPRTVRSNRVRDGRSTRRGLVYGPGALLAAARDDRLMWALHRAALVRGLVPVVPAPAVAEAVRAAGSRDALAGVLDGIEIEEVGGEAAVRLGELSARAGADNLVTVATVETAARRNLAAVAERSPRMAEIAASLDHDLVLHAP